MFDPNPLTTFLDRIYQLSSQCWGLEFVQLLETVSCYTLTAYLMAKFRLLSRASRAALVARGNQESEPYSITEATQASIIFSGGNKLEALVENYAF